MPWSFSLPSLTANHRSTPRTPHGLSVLPDALDADLCQQLVERAESATANKLPVPPAWSRGGTKTLFDDEELTGALWPKLAPSIAAPLDGWVPVGLNEHLEVTQHEKGQRFAWHTDSPYIRDHEERSLLSVLVLLNNEYEGGEISFEPDANIQAKVGQALIFPHNLPYRSAPVKSGARFVLRTDVVFRVPGKLLQLH